MKKFVLAFAIASLAVACKSSDSTQVSDPSSAAVPEAGAACDMAGKKECTDAMKAECSTEAKKECSSAKVCPMTGAAIN